MRFQKKKLLLLLCMIFALMSIMLTGCGSSSKSASEGSGAVSVPPPSAETKTFENTKEGMKFNYPVNWEVKSDKKMIASYNTSKASKEKDLYSFNIIVSESKEKIDWNTYGKQMEKDLLKQLKEGKILSNTNVKVAGCDGVKLEYTSKAYDIKMKSFSVIFGKDKKLYVITAGGNEAAFDKNASAMDNLVKSISLK